jgi:hypothetical protein
MAMEDEVPLSVTEVGSTNITATATLATEARGGNGPKQNSAEAPSSHLYREPSASNARVDECETERKDARKGGGLSYYGVSTTFWLDCPLVQFNQLPDLTDSVCSDTRTALDGS